MISHDLIQDSGPFASEISIIQQIIGQWLEMYGNQNQKKLHPNTTIMQQILASGGIKWCSPVDADDACSLSEGGELELPL